VIDDHQIITERAEVAGSIRSHSSRWPTQQAVTFADEMLMSQASNTSASSPLNSWIFYMSPPVANTDTSETAGTSDERNSAIEKFLSGLLKEPEDESEEDSSASLAIDSITKRPFHTVYKSLLWPTRYERNLNF